MKKGVKKEDLDKYFHRRYGSKLYPKSVFEGSLSVKDKTNIEIIYEKHMASQGNCHAKHY